MNGYGETSHPVSGNTFRISMQIDTFYVRPRTEPRTVRSGRTTISSAWQQVPDLYSVSFKRLDSIRALTYKRWPTELINNFAHGGSRDEVSQWELNKNIQELAMADVFVTESIHGTTVSNLKTAVCSQNTLYIAVYSHKILLRLFPLVQTDTNVSQDRMETILVSATVYQQILIMNLQQHLFYYILSRRENENEVT